MKWEQCFTEICNSLFRISLSYNSINAWGTGFPIAKYKIPGNLSLVLATAKHVVSFSANDTVDWKIEQFDLHGNLKQNISFKSNNSITGNSPIRTHTEFDIAGVFVPNIGSIDQYKPLRTIPASQAIMPGTKVGWAGFPSLAHELLSNQPCYYEGVISAVADRGNRLYYIIDGHNGPGVSGGPVWCWNDEESNYDIIGLASSYVFRKENPALPGLCVFESINPLMAYLSSSTNLEINSSIQNGHE